MNNLRIVTNNHILDKIAETYNLAFDKINKYLTANNNIGKIKTIKLDNIQYKLKHFKGVDKIFLTF